MKQHQKKKNSLSETRLMERVLQVRYTDLEEERLLCTQLLETAEPQRNAYVCAFAHVYLCDCCLAQGDYDGFAFYLTRADGACRENHYDDLLLVLCNCAGLYYLKLNDEQTALDYYLQGLRLARRLEDYDTLGKLLNNIGVGFGGRGDWKTARAWFSRAAEVMEQHLEQVNSAHLISYLCNVSEASQWLGDSKASARALLRCEQRKPVGEYQVLRLACAWCAHYGIMKDREHCLQRVERVLQLGLLQYESQFFVCDMCVGLCENMMDIGEGAYAKFFLDALEKLEQDAPLVTRYRVQCLRVRFWREQGDKSEEKTAYRHYYEVMCKMAEMDDEVRAQSMLSKIQLTRVQKAREAMRKQNNRLERESQLDELTGLYNRRYFNKLVSKVSQVGVLTRLGYVMLDLDYFKQYNDFYGHFAGDDALRAVAHVLKQHVTEAIHASRIGGDEFVCLCVNCTDEAVLEYIENVRCSLVAQNIAHEKSKCGSILTVSIGWCNEEILPSAQGESLLQIADEALYRAKEEGRNRWARKRLTKLD